MYIYLYLDLFTAFFPLVLSFDKRVQFLQKWKFFFPAMSIVALFFLVWDALFTQWGIWSFNYDHLLGVSMAGLPLEEILFFVVVPFACVFLYEVFRHYLPKDFLRPLAPGISLALGLVLPIVAVINMEHYYTSFTFMLTGLLLLYMQFYKKADYMGWFYLAYMVSLAPFLLVNGILTKIPIVEYNDQFNLGIRLFTIPIEDTVYSMLLLLMNIGLFEYFQQLSANRSKAGVLSNSYK